jgi:hypothetical protein
LKSNLLSIGQLQEKGYVIVIKDKKCQIQDPKQGLIAEVGMTRNRMFPLNIECMTSSCFAAKVKNPAWIWHLRYGHLNFNGLKTLYRRNMVKGLPQIDSPSEICEDCAVSKQLRDPFPKGKSRRASKTLEIVHYDICGPISPTSNGKKRYFITFTDDYDDYSRKTWVYLFEKSEAFSAFQKYKALVENDTGNLIKILRTDRGGEINSHEFSKFCDDCGIQRQLTAAYTPQQNGVLERKNRTIMNMVRCMLTTGCVPKSFWPEAVNWSIDVLNRCPTLSVKDKTPEEL